MLGGRIAVMQRGAIMQIGRPLDLYRQPVNTFVGTFLGSPPELLDTAKDFVARYNRRYPGIEMKSYDHYGYEVAEILLDDR